MKRTSYGIAVLWLALAGSMAHAQEWPAKPVKLVVPVPPGGALDPFARALASRLTDTFKHNFTVENRAGGSGSLGTAYVAGSAPDGHTFGFVYDTHAVNPALIPRMPFDTLKDLAPVMLIGSSPLLIAVNPDKPLPSFDAVVAAVRARPDSVNIGSTGNGSLGHLALLQMRREQNLQLNHIPYKGGGPLVQDLVGGQIDLGIAGVPNMLPHVRSKRITALAVTSEKRSPSLPEVPTLQELGMSGVRAYTWWGLFAPAATPRPIIDRLHAALRTILATPDITKMLNETLAMDTVASSPEALQQFVSTELNTWTRVVRENNVKAD